jgi:hypothetical protein
VTRYLSIGSVLLIFLLACAGVAWTDRSVWPGDRGLYGENAATLFWSLTHDPLRVWLWNLFDIMAWQTPLLPWVAQFLSPLGRWFEYPQTALLLLNPLVQTLSLSLFAAAAFRLWRSPSVVLTATAAIAVTPLFFCIGYAFYVEPLQGLAVSAALLLAACDESLGWAESALFTALILCVGFLAKITTPAYQLPWLAAAVFARMRSMRSTRSGNLGPAFRKGRLLRWTLAGVSSLFLLLVAGWASTHLSRLHEFWPTVNPSALFSDTGSTRPFGAKVLWWLGHLAGATYFLSYRAIFAGLACLALVGRWNRRKSKSAWRHADRLALASLLTIPAFLLVAGNVVSEDVRYAHPLLIHLGVCLAWVLGELDPGPLKQARAAVLILPLLALQLGTVTLSSLGYLEPGQGLKIYGLLPVRDPRLLARVVQTSRELCPARPPVHRLTLVGSCAPSFDAESLTLAARLDGRMSCQFREVRDLSPDESPLDQRYANLMKASYDRLAFDTWRPGPIQLRGFDRLQDYIYPRIRRDPSFQLVSRNDLGVEVYERR